MVAVGLPEREVVTLGKSKSDLPLDHFVLGELLGILNPVSEKKNQQFYKISKIQRRVFVGSKIIFLVFPYTHPAMQYIARAEMFI